jgi:molybdopterin-guanine dinucleotide biosynthesis protein A
MDCVIVAGGRPGPNDPLFSYTNGEPKALLDMGGRTMLERVVDALQASQHVEECVVVGLGPEIAAAAGFSFQRPVHHLADQGSLVGNALAGMAWAHQRRPAAETIMLCSSDIPALTPSVVDDHVNQCRPFDHSVYYSVVTKQVLERRFPASNRTFVRLRELEVAGGDIMIARPEVAETNPEIWQALANARKHAWKLARIVGFGTLVRFLLHRLSLAEAQAAAERLVGCSVKVIISPHAEVAMDADKPHQVDLLRATWVTGRKEP